MGEPSLQHHLDTLTSRAAASGGIRTGPGWNMLLASLEKDLSAIDPDYLVLAVREKLARLRFLWAPSSEALSCCRKFNSSLFASPDLPGDSALFDTLAEHLASREHAASQLYSHANGGVFDERRRMLMDATVRAAESLSGRTCVSCGAAGRVHNIAGEYRTFCEGCYRASL